VRNQGQDVDVNHRGSDREDYLLQRVRDLEAALAAAESRSDAWLSLVSHDLRGPLTLILGYAENLLHRARTGRDAGRSIHDLEAIVFAARRLNKMVTQVVEGARLDSKRLVLNRRPTDLPPLLREAARAAFKLYPTHPLRVDIPEQLPAVDCDPRAVDTIVGALLSNAAVFSPADSPIVLTAREAGAQVVISIADRGVGLQPDERDRVFEPRYRPERIRDARREGVGLSLWIARGLALMSSGDLCVASDGPGLGMTATLTLPKAVADQATTR
jgi:signal transduction histidine kinase